MADPRKPFRFKQGHCPNPGGRPKLPPAVNAAWRLTREEFVREMCELWQYTTEQLQAVLAEPKTSIGRLMIARTLLMAGEGNDKAREVVLERLIGKVADKLDLGESLEALIAGARMKALPATIVEAQVVHDQPAALPAPIEPKPEEMK